MLTYLLSECWLFFSKNIYIIASAYEIKSEGYNILYYNILNNKDTGQLKNSKDNTNYLETFYNHDNPFIIAANCGNVKIFDYLNNKLIKKFSDKDNSINYLSVVIHKNNNKARLISTSSDGILRIWDYNEPQILLESIQTYSHSWLVGLDLINDQYLLGACADGSIKEFDLKNRYVSCALNRVHDKDPLFVVNHLEINGEIYLFTHSFKGLIELWK